jgi:hypothetical protein
MTLDIRKQSLRICLRSLTPYNRSELKFTYIQHWTSDIVIAMYEDLYTIVTNIGHNQSCAQTLRIYPVYANLVKVVLDIPT